MNKQFSKMKLFCLSATTTPMKRQLKYNRKYMKSWSWKNSYRSLLKWKWIHETNFGIFFFYCSHFKDFFLSLKLNSLEEIFRKSVTTWTSLLNRKLNLRFFDVFHKIFLVFHKKKTTATKNVSSKLFKIVIKSLSDLSQGGWTGATKKWEENEWKNTTSWSLFLLKINVSCLQHTLTFSGHPISFSQNKKMVKNTKK